MRTKSSFSNISFIDSGSCPVSFDIPLLAANSFSSILLLFSMSSALSSAGVSPNRAFQLIIRKRFSMSRCRNLFPSLSSSMIQKEPSGISLSSHENSISSLPGRFTVTDKAWKSTLMLRLLCESSKGMNTKTLSLFWCQNISPEDPLQ